MDKRFPKITIDVLKVKLLVKVHKMQLKLQ